MKNATLIIATLTLSLTGILRAQVTFEDGDANPASKTAPEVTVAAMPVPMRENPVKMLPGMSPVQPALSAPQALPIPLITDLTNYPNPFDSRKAGAEGSTIISYQLAQGAKTTITVYTLLGKKVREMSFSAGTQGGRQGVNEVSWDGTNEEGQKVSKGGYFAQIYAETPTTNVMVVRKIGVIH